MHHRVANLHEDTLHKLTTRLTREYGTIVVEDLDVAGTVRNRRLSRRVADAAFGEIRRRLTYKTRRHGTRLIVAGRWFPSSKACSRCGAVKAELPLSLRVFECDTCGLVLDRHENAGHNLLALATRNTRTTCLTGTGVAGDLDPAAMGGVEAPWSQPQDPHHPPAPSGRDGAGRGHNPRPRAGTEAGDRQQDTPRTQLALW
ncbi:RNA-guided endonuclease InsQ/TnpB family protein [Streptomyces sp. NPDC014685]|uniref:RNA-guided endonuclease InsQ/TnpB family protein n=1 Tax=Streptomyces sp. NPDC014685 TaxID=3364881 RepID=UPI0036FE0A6C